ncbi:MAG: ATP-binding cassette domain-containing protein, partial [Gammaproteobacteria bacterium]|nr:ATP-binding cassette domain-containing protein [Gammaproteobacteria bacterium]
MTKSIEVLVDNLYVGYGSEQVLHIESLKIPHKVVYGLLGPSGTGKSTFLKVLCRLDEFDPTLWSEGKINFNNKNLLDESSTEYARKHFSILRQKSRFYGDSVLECVLDGLTDQKIISKEEAENFAKSVLDKLNLWDMFKDNLNTPIMELSPGFHKLIIIAKLAYNSPSYMVLDEPFRDFAIVEEPYLKDVIKQLKQTMGVILVTHNKIYAKEVCDEIALLSGARLIETGSSENFFKSPTTKVGRNFLQSGSAWPELEEEEEAANEKTVKEFSDKTKLKKQFPRLSSFYWVIPGQIGGTQRPGLLSDEEEDIRRLNSIHVDYLVSLTQKKVELSKYPDNKIEGIHFPIVDMDIPDLKKTHEFLVWLVPNLEKGKSAIFHCKAGIGRTGTMLACTLVFMGMSAAQAIEKVRTVFYQ